MPFAAPTNFDDDPNKKNQNGGVNISGQSTTFAANVPGQEGNSPSKDAKSSGQYSNIQSYLDANKSQADQMGQRITGDVSQKADDATQKIGAFETQAPKIDAYDPNAALGKVTILSDEEKTNYKTMKQTGGYTGPQTVDQVTGYGDMTKSAQAASQDVKNAGSETGQQQLLKQTYARPQYSAGENRLDQVLLQNSAGSKSNLEGLAQKYSGLDQMLSGAQQKVGEAVNSANTQALANKQAFNPAETKYRNDLINPIQQRADQTYQYNQLAGDRIKDDASDYILSDETLAALNLTPGQTIFDLNIGNYVTPDKAQVGMNNVATADERSRYAALQALLDDPTMTQITADGKAIKPVSFDQQNFNKDLTKKEAQYKDAYANQRGSILNPNYLVGATNLQVEQPARDFETK